MTSLDSELQTVKKDVEWLLSEYPVCRNSDGWLFFLYMSKILNIPFPWLNPEQIKQLNGLESVRRLRQKFQENGEYLPTDPVVSAKRRMREDFFRGNMKL